MRKQDVDFFMREWGSNPAVNMEVHSACCKYCPSAHGPDPETEEILKLPYELRKYTVFPCAWRTEKVCKGIHDLVTPTVNKELG